MALDLAAAAAELVRRDTAEQGLPERITSPAVLEQVAAIVIPRPERADGRTQGSAA
jgi:hypothetical protein